MIVILSELHALVVVVTEPANPTIEEMKKLLDDHTFRLVVRGGWGGEENKHPNNPLLVIQFAYGKAPLRALWKKTVTMRTFVNQKLLLQ